MRPTGLARSSWPKFHADNDNSGSGGGRASRGVTRWSYQTHSNGIGSGAIGANGLVYAGCAGFGQNYLYAFDTKSGEVRWRFQSGENKSPGAYSAYGFGTCPAVASDGTVYVGSNDYRFYALDGNTGQKKWEFETGNFVGGSPAIGPDGTVYFTSCDRKAYAVDGVTGKKKWEFVTGGMVGTPALSRKGVLYLLSNDKKLYAVTSKTGEKRWETLIPGPGGSTPVVGSNNVVYIGAGNGEMYAIDGMSGRTLWVRLLERELGGAYGTPALGRNGLLYATAGFRTFALNRMTGKTRWTFRASYYMGTPSVGGDGTVYVGTSDFRVFALEGSTGRKKWAFEVGGRAGVSDIAIGSDGTIYFGSADGKFYAVH